MNMTGGSGLKHMRTLGKQMTVNNFYVNTRMEFNTTQTDVTRTTFTMKVREVPKMDYRLVKNLKGGTGNLLLRGLSQTLNQDSAFKRT